jgi:hypothetical protein
MNDKLYPGPPGWQLIEREGDLYRGPSAAWPKDVWIVQTCRWEQYLGTVPKPGEWGHVLTPWDARFLVGAFEPFELIPDFGRLPRPALNLAQLAEMIVPEPGAPSVKAAPTVAPLPQRRPARMAARRRWRQPSRRS